MKALLLPLITVITASCAPAQRQPEKSPAEYAADFNRTMFACVGGIGAHDAEGPKAILNLALRLEMPDPDNAIATIFTSRCTTSRVKFFFCGAAATRKAGGVIVGKKYFYGEYDSGQVSMISRGKEAEKDCAGMMSGDRDI